MYWHIQNNAKKERKYPNIKEGDMVRVHIKKNKFQKGHEPTYSKERYKVVDVKGNQFLFHPLINLNCFSGTKY